MEKKQTVGATEEEERTILNVANTVYSGACFFESERFGLELTYLTLSKTDAADTVRSPFTLS